MLDAARCQSRLEELAARMTASPGSPFGMSGIALFASDAHGTTVRVYRGSDPLGVPLTPDSRVCLASVGKMAVALLVLRLVDRGVILLDQPLNDALVSASALRYGDAGRARMGDLLSHRAGLPPVFTQAELPYPGEMTASLLRARCRMLSLGSERQVCYSDLGYALLTDVIEHCGGQPLNGCLEELNGALGTRLGIGAAPGPDYVRVSGVPSAHVGTEVEPLNSAFWHRLALPWAGICGAPEDGLMLVRAFASGAVLSESLRRQAITDPDGGSLTGGIPANTGQMGIDPIPSTSWSPCPWGLGVEIKGDKAPHWTPREAPSNSFGHVGISGTLAWHDPDTGLSWAMCGTRSSHSGWFFRHGPLLGRAVLQSALAENPGSSM